MHRNRIPRRVIGSSLRAMASVLVCAGLTGAESIPEPGYGRAVVRVGIDEGDLRGTDHRALQAAVDYVASLGGGTVKIGPGRYVMRNALTLRDNVRVVGVPGKTVLVACDGVKTRLAADGDCNQREIVLNDPAGFRVGDGVAITDQRNSSGFTVTTATLVARTGPGTFKISRPLYVDYMVRNEATARLTFPVIGGWNVEGATVEGIVVEGNRSRFEAVDGCRAAGIYLFECERIAIRDCTVRDYAGDGISFQVSSHVTVENCASVNNGGIGIHPGSGSQRPVVRGNRSLGNGTDGLYVCWRVKHGLFENNQLKGNKRCGISIGHKDTDNRFVGNTIVENGDAGVLFRNEDEAMGAHRNVFERNRIVDNGTRKGSERAAIVIRGHHHDLVFRDNEIGNTKRDASGIGVLSNENTKRLKADDNRFINVKTRIRTGIPVPR